MKVPQMLLGPRFLGGSPLAVNPEGEIFPCFPLRETPTQLLQQALDMMQLNQQLPFFRNNAHRVQRPRPPQTQFLPWMKDLKEGV